VIATLTFDETMEADDEAKTAGEIESMTSNAIESRIEGYFTGVQVTDVTAIATKTVAASGAPATGLGVTALMMSILLLADRG